MFVLKKSKRNGEKEVKRKRKREREEEQKGTSLRKKPFSFIQESLHRQNRLMVQYLLSK